MLIQIILNLSAFRTKYINQNPRSIMSSLSHKFLSIKKTIDHQDKRPIVFINANFSNCDTLIQQIIPEVRVIVINPEADGVREITRIMNSSYCRAMYIISQGIPGCIYVGHNELSLNTLIQYSSELQSWFDNGFNNASDTNFDVPRLYLYGCDVAAGDVGEEFMTKLTSMVGATIAASARVPKNNILN